MNAPTREDVIRMAQEAGIDWSGKSAEDVLVLAMQIAYADGAAAAREARIAAQKQVEALQAENARNEADRLAAVLSEREACAKLCESLPTVGELRQLERATMKDCAVAIRARGQ